MRMSRKLGLYGRQLTFADLFGNPYSSVILGAGRSESSAATMSLSLGTNILNRLSYDNIYLFYTVGGCIEISRLGINNGEITKTLLATKAPSGHAKYNTSVSGTTIITASSYSCNMTIYGFSRRYSRDLIDQMFTEAAYYTPKYYYNSALTDTDANLQVAKSNLAETNKGILIASYRDVPSGGNRYDGGSQCSVFDVSAAATPATSIRNCAWSPSAVETWYGDSALKEKTTSGTTYVLPKSTGSGNVNGNARVRSYTLKRLEETW